MCMYKYQMRVIAIAYLVEVPLCQEREAYSNTTIKWERVRGVILGVLLADRLISIMFFVDPYICNVEL